MSFNVTPSLDELALLKAAFQNQQFELPNLADDLGRRPKKKRSLKVRSAKLPRLERQLRAILSALRTGNGASVRIDAKADHHYFRKALAALKARDAVNITKGYWDRANKANCRAAEYTPTTRTLAALRAWTNFDPPVIPAPNKKQARALMAPLNEEFAKHTYLGCDVPVLARYMKTKEGNPHGRMYAIGRNSYQRRKNREDILIDGKPCVEIDVTGSQLTIFLGMWGSTRGQGDPYAIPGLPREVVKQAILFILGKCTVEGISWRQNRDEHGKVTKENPPACRYHKIQDVVDRIVETYPELKTLRPEHRGILCMAESEAIYDTVEALRAMGIVALPTHDALLVQAEHEATARDLLVQSYQQRFERAPLVKTASASKDRWRWGDLTELWSTPSAQSAALGGVLSIEDLIQDILAKACTKTRRVSGVSESNRRSSTDKTTNPPPPITLQLGESLIPRQGRGGARKGAGRRPTVSYEDVRALLQNGSSYRQAAKILGVSRAAVERAAKKTDGREMANDSGHSQSEGPTMPEIGPTAAMSV